MKGSLIKQQAEAFGYDRRTREPGFDMKNSHYHPDYELYYLISGHSRIFINHTLHDVEPGTAVLIRPMEIHRTTYPAGNTNERIAVNFTREYLRDLELFCGKEETEKLLVHQKLEIPAARRPYVEALLDKIGFESGQEDLYSNLLKRNHLYEVLILLDRCRDASAQPRKIEGTEGVIQETARYLYHHYDLPVTLEEIAGIAHMSPSYFSRKFKRVTGFGFKEYLNHVRIRKACELLLQTENSVTDIALSCGFNDGNYFGDVFRREKGVSPNQYRKNPEVC